MTGVSVKGAGRNMKYEEFIDQLLEELKDFDPEDREQIREYFEEMICDRMENGEAEEEILQSFGTPRMAAERLRNEYEMKEEESFAEKKAAILTKEEYIGNENGIQPKEQLKEESRKAPVTSIFIHTEEVRIVLQKDKVERPVVEFEPREGRDFLTVTEENGCFKIVHQYRKILVFRLFGFEKTRDMIVRIPEDFQGELEMESGNVSMEVNDFMNLKSLVIRTSNAGISVTNTDAVKMKLKTTNAKIVVTNAKAKEMNFKSSNASVRMENLQADNLEVHSSNGKLSLKNGAIEGKAELTTSNAQIEVENVSGTDITLHTSNGAVKGVLAGSIADYNVTSATSNGSSTLPTHMNTGKDKNLNVGTSNGKIAIAFEKDLKFEKQL